MTNTRTKQEERTLYIILAAALAARLLLALVTEGYTYDMSCFVAWGDKLASEGPAAFYSADYFADYPPGYILVLGLVSLVRKALQLSYESRWTYFLLALIPAICDCAAVVLLDHISRRYMGQGRAQRCLVLFAAFCPLTLFDTGIWKQIDGAFALPLLLCFWLLVRSHRKTPEEKEAEAVRQPLDDAGTPDEVMHACIGEVCTTMQEVTRIYNRTLVAVFKENRKMPCGMAKAR